MSDPASPRPSVLVTGPSGAGRSTAIRALEDLGYEAIDNLPLSLVPRLLGAPGPERPMAFGVDARNRDFSASALAELSARIDSPIQTLYLDCRREILLRRFSETRRRHPLAPGDTPGEGIDRELDLLGPARARADILVDTSEMTPHDLRAEMERWFAPPGGRRLAVSIHSFSYRRGIPRGLDIVLDCRFLRNPHWDETLRPLDGKHPDTARFVADDPKFADFVGKAADLAHFLLPAYESEGKAYLAVGLGCTGGRHRSVVVAETLAAELARAGWEVSARHRELERGVPSSG